MMMKILPRSLLLALTLGVVPVVGKPWRGIIPLRSLRSDVETILGAQGKKAHDWTIYQTEETAISILYARGLPCQSSSNSEWRVPDGTVLSITVTPKTLVRLSDLNLDLARYQRISDSHSSVRTEYIDKEEGESISVANGEVSSVTYFGNSRDSVRCTRIQPAEPEAIRGMPRFDRYGDLKFGDEKIRLDNFAIALGEISDATGYVVIHPRRDMSARELRRRVQRVRTYLLKTRRFGITRISTIMTNPVAEFSVELFIVPNGLRPSSGVAN